MPSALENLSYCINVLALARALSCADCRRLIYVLPHWPARDVPRYLEVATTVLKL